jgi:hypothetical protein
MVCLRSFALSRRRFLRGASLAGVSGAVLNTGLLATPASAGLKVSQAAASYRPSSQNTARCETCVQFQPPGACKVVDGAISPSGWCSFYAAKR